MSGYHYLEQDDVSGVVARLKDGSTWYCEYDTSGHLVPVKEVNRPQPPAKPKPRPSPSTGTGAVRPGAGAEAEGTTPGGRFDPLGSRERTGLNLTTDKSTAILPTLDDTVFRQRLSSIMTDNKYDRHLRGRTRGKLDMTRLPKVMTGSQSVFTQKQARKNKMYNVVLVVDQSGSMNESGYEDEDGDWIDEGKRRIEHAADITSFIAKSMVGLNIDLAILGFNHYQRLYKTFDQPISDYGKLHRRLIEDMSIGGSCNHDYDAIARAYDLLKGREGQSIVLFMSDGAPASCIDIDRVIDDPERLNGGSSHRYRTEHDGLVSEMWFDRTTKGGTEFRDQRVNLNHLVKAHDGVTTIGIGIQTDCWQCPENVTVNDLGNMKPKVIEVLQRKIKRG